jgi:hypothetical protein
MVGTPVHWRAVDDESILSEIRMNEAGLTPFFVIVPAGLVWRRARKTINEKKNRKPIIHFNRIAFLSRIYLSAFIQLFILFIYK